ncbi:MAG: enoyl-CoA hydratase-related protein [Chloroflexota bacterium]
MPRIHYDKQDHIAVITMEGDNDLNIGTINDEFHDRIDQFRSDDDLWCAVITGAGQRSFCAGANLSGALSGGFGTLRVPELLAPQRPTLLTGLECWKPIIAAVNGHAIGAGFMLALACDIRVASDNATFALTEVKFGWPAGQGAIQRLPRLISLGPALEMLLTGDRIPASKALEWGLMNQVTPQAGLMDAAMELAGRIAANPPLSVRVVKELTYRGLELSFDQSLRMTNLMSAIARTTEDFREATSAFGEKRKGNFKGR